MNNKSILIAVISLLLFVSHSQAQIRDVKWEPFLQHPCYKGLSVSVLNMGWSNDVKTYLWGVRIKNNYNTAVTFRYSLNVGDEKKDLTKYYGDVAYRLKPGDTLTNGEDALRGIMFKTSAIDWTVMVGEVCFDGMRCGGEDDCYADCDVSARKVNQPCGLEAHTTTKPRSGIWETKKNVMVKIELTDKGLVFTNAGIDFNFSKISEDEYEWVKGKYIHLKFNDANYFDILEYGEDYSSEFYYKPNTPLSSYDPSSDCCDVSFFEGEWTDVDKKTKISITSNANGFTLKKQNSSVLYQYTLNPRLKYQYNRGKGVFLIMNIEDQNKFYCAGIEGPGDYFTEAFYTRLKPIKDTVNKPKTPIVKKEEKPIVENKPVTVTENKTVSALCELNGEWKRVWVDGYSEREVYATIRTTADGLNWSLPFRNENLFFKKTSSITYRCDPGASQQWWYYYILTCEKNNTISLKKYHKQDGHHEVTETYSQSK